MLVTTELFLQTLAMCFLVVLFEEGSHKASAGLRLDMDLWMAGITDLSHQSGFHVVLVKSWRLTL